MSYPKLIALFCSFILAYLLYAMGVLHEFVGVLNGHGLVSVFLGGLLFSFGFTSALGVGIFVEVASGVSPWVAAPVAGVGALLSDVLIFQFVRFSIFHDEIRRLRASRIFQSIRRLFYHESVSDAHRKILLWSFAGIVIASPFPDEFGAILLSSVTTMQPQQFAFLCFLLNTAGILLILLAARGFIA